MPKDTLENLQERVELTEAPQTIEEGRMLIEKLNEIKDKAENLDKIPSHSEIAEIYKHNDSDVFVQIAKSCFEIGLKTAGENGGRMEGLDEAIECPLGTTFGNYIYGEIAKDQRQIAQLEPGETLEEQPTVYVEKVLDKKGNPTGEALVLVRLNNGTDIRDRTVAMALMKYDTGGKIEYDESGKPVYIGQSFFGVMSERDYLEETRILQMRQPPVQTPENDEDEEEARATGLGAFMKNMRENRERQQEIKKAKKEFDEEFNDPERLFCLGKLTCSQYERKGKPSSFWKKWDSELEKDFNYGRSERLKGDLIARLEGRYGELTAQAEQRIKEITEQTNKLVEEQHKKVEEKILANTGVFEVAFNALESDDPDTRRMGEAILGRDFDFTPEDMERAKAFYKTYDEMRTRRAAQRNNGGHGGNTP